MDQCLEEIISQPIVFHKTAEKIEKLRDNWLTHSYLLSSWNWIRKGKIAKDRKVIPDPIDDRKFQE